MIRPGTLLDAAPIADIYSHYVLTSTSTFETAPIDPTAMAERLRASIDGGYPFYVWEEDGQVLGWACAHRWRERPAYCITAETTIYLHPDAKGRGIGRQLMLRVIDDCQRLPLHSLIACITAENVRSVEFHRTLGFEQVALHRQVGHKLGRLLDVVDMQLMLDNDNFLA